MANVTKNNVSRQVRFGGTPYGNQWAGNYNFSTDDTGVLVESSQDTPIVAADVVRLGILPAGLEIHDSLALVSAAFSGGTTADVGFEYVDGVDDTEVPQDADYFNAALDTATPARTVAGNVAVSPVTLPKDAYLTLTIAGTHAQAGILDFIVTGIWTGVPSANP